MLARLALRTRVVAREGLGVVDTELDSFADDLGFGPGDQRSMDDQAIALDCGFGGKICHRFEGADVFWTAIGIAAVVQGVYADVDIHRTEDFGPSQGVGKKDGVSSWDVGQGDIGSEFLGRIVFGNGQIFVGQSAASEACQVELDDSVLCDVCIAGDLLSALEFQRVALAVSEADGIGDKTGIFADRQAGG